MFEARSCKKLVLKVVKFSDRSNVVHPEFSPEEINELREIHEAQTGEKHTPLEKILKDLQKLASNNMIPARNRSNSMDEAEIFIQDELIHKPNPHEFRHRQALI